MHQSSELSCLTQDNFGHFIESLIPGMSKISSSILKDFTQALPMIRLFRPNTILDQSVTYVIKGQVKVMTREDKLLVTLNEPLMIGEE